MLETGKQADWPPSSIESNSIPPSQPRATVVARLGGSIPTMLVVMALAGVAALGHHTGWTIPKFSALTGNGGRDKEDWCSEHTVPESLCVECNPSLLPKGKEYGWCKKHGVQECPLCHPEVAQLPARPLITTADLERAQKALSFAERSENNNKCKLQQRRLQFASEDAVKKAGIDVAPAWQAPMSEFVASNGEIGYDLTHVARLSSRVGGAVWRVEKQVGDKVQNGEVLALVDAVDVGKAKAEFLHAYAQADLKARVVQAMQKTREAIPDARVQEAETALREARIRLLSAQQVLINLGLPIQADELKSLPEDRLTVRVQFLGLPDSVTQALDPRTTTANLIPIRAPIDGVIVAREVVAGEVVDTTKVLFVVADTRTMWLNLDVRLEDTRQLAVGQKIRFRPDGSQKEVAGQVTWLSTAVDEKTRTVKVRAALANTDGQLRANTFGSGRIILREEKNAVVVPRDAIQWEGCCHVVFVRDKNFLKEGAPKVFHVRKVVPGAKDDANIEIIAGILPGEVIATKGSGVLRSELLKNNLGEG
jgi:cobalt-zinc-cadmium efflux system membrane fusion protein